MGVWDKMNTMMKRSFRHKDIRKMIARAVRPAMVSLLMLSGVVAAGAAVTDLPVTTVAGRKCYYYDVQPKESIYQVAQKLGVTRDDILQEIPALPTG